MDAMLGSLDACKPACNDVGSLPNGTVSTIQGTHSSSLVTPCDANLGRHLARRLVEIGVTDVFSVPGDFNLTLLDHLIAEPNLNVIGCCNELNAGYAADGYARSRGVGACVVTFTVGGLSVLNAIAGAYSENLPVICIVGGPNTNDYGTNRILHHTIGLPDFTQELRCFQTVTCYQAVVNNLEDAHEMLDTAISTALKESKPVYISISCNLAAIPHPTFSREPVPFSLSPKLSNQMGLEAAVEAAADFLNKAVKPVLVGGPKLRVAKASDAFVELADACGYAFGVMPSAKGLVPENHPHFIGTFWGAVSTSFCAEIVESADAYLFAGPIFNDYSSVGYSLLLKKEKAIIVQPDRVVIGNGPAFGCVLMKDFLKALAKRLKHNNTSYENYYRIFVPDGKPISSEPGAPLRVNILFQHIQNMLSSETAVIAETGDSWFNCQKLKLPKGCGYVDNRYEFQMQYGSIGWSVGATLGYAQAVPEKRVIACIGDGSFQVTAQDVSTMLRCGQKTIIFLINNGGYTIEVEIHDGPYNVIKNWNYTGLVDAIHNGEGKCWTTKVTCEEELVNAIETATGAKKDCFCFIEVICHKDDTSKELLEWGSRVCAANSRPPNPQ
ncbi:pyruvate decarboxylase 2 isoform X1 [Arachis ipaensis]|uniref:pyruvate decarboxylase 2 isoform X1 n=1 Tax=Arachis ipaensis TaxID=130454 RepID=UPI000A2B8190|nr:pyruvate decarboxylase 2 isoform X1 [Arachis ipaensis]XP_025633791.1 pyruvate decarboxylase 2 isoform X1 [Arachis hypogaea]QHO24801.1 Pyruvate decarboxylase [Arachis hypogaea]